MCVRGCNSSKKAERRVTWYVQVLRSPNLFKKTTHHKKLKMRSFLNVITLQTYTFFTKLTPRLHGRNKRFFRRPQNLNAPRMCERCPVPHLPVLRFTIHLSSVLLYPAPSLSTNRSVLCSAAVFDPISLCSALQRVFRQEAIQTDSISCLPSRHFYHLRL